MRRSLTVLAPIAAGALVFALAASYPISAVHGSALTGPDVPKSIANIRLSDAYRTRWVDHGQAILLRVRDGRRCEPKVEAETSTGPARVEVRVDRPTGPDCLAQPRWWRLRLAPPPIRARRQAVGVYVDGDWTSLGPPTSL